ncbi:MAG TPA: DinB family protein [Fimbriimonas sp.]|nr:DinB family protein [Fimbriimonas sp.]
MQDLQAQLLEMWDRQSGMIANISRLIDDSSKQFLPSPDGWSIAKHLAHVHEVRYWWLTKVAPDLANNLGESFQEDGETPLEDLQTIKDELAKSAHAVRTALERELRDETQQTGPYSHPVQYLGHMVWHEGWHAGIILLALRLNGREPAEQWEETNLWGIWRS